MQLVDIDATLQAFRKNPSVMVWFPEGQGLEILVKPHEQRQIIQKHSQNTFSVSPELLQKIFALQKELGKDQLVPEDLEGHDDLFAMAMNVSTDATDYYAIGCELAQDCCGWVGFKGEFDKDKAVAFVSHVAEYAEFLGENYEAGLKEYEQEHLKRVEEEEKN